MRRTYRSKKDAGGCIDPKDLVSYVDAKSSVFDAFYIQNIKQTKREVSCQSSSHQYQNKGAAYNINKRKYVKRPLKESPICQDKRYADSAEYLTPDKSIHVNKAPDPFDLLLKSSPACTVDTNPRQFTEKTYGRKLGKRIRKHKKNLNESTDSDKENYTRALNQTTADISDINNYKLIEEVDYVPPPCRDESIENVERHLPHLSNIQHSNSNCIKTQQSLSETEKNTEVSNSPLCSTPFSVKCRSKSIYKFSPILLDLSITPKSLKKHFNVISGNEVNTQKNITPEAYESVIASNSYCKNLTLNSNPHLTVQMRTPKSHRDTLFKNTCNSYLLTTEIEPFYGFPNTSGINLFSKPNSDSVAKSGTDTSSIEVSDQDYSTNNKENSISLEPVDSNLEKTDHSCKNQSDMQILDYVSLYDTCDNDKLCSDPKACCLDNDYLPTPIVLVEKMRSSLFYKYYDKNKDCSSKHNKSGFKNDNSDNDSNIINEQNLNDSQYTKCLESDSINNDYSVSSNFKEDKEIIEPDQDFKSYLSEEDEDRCISFVTTRRGKKLTSNPVVFIDIDTFTPNSVNHHINPTYHNKYSSPGKYDANIEIDECENKLHTSTNENKPTIPKSADKMGKADTKALVQTTRDNSCEKNYLQDFDSYTGTSNPIVLQPGKKWERSLSIYKRMTAIADSFDYSVLEDETSKCKGRRYRQSVIETMEMQKVRDSFQNDSHIGRRSTFTCGRTTFKILKNNRDSSTDFRSSVVCEDLRGFLSEDCDDTIIELSKLSIDDSVHEVTVLEKFHESGRKACARDYVLRRCNQTDAIPFDECYPDPELKNCHKIGEGVYGEVFLWRACDGQARVLKIIPIAGDIKVNGEPQKGFHEIISEIVIAMELSALRSPIAAIEKLLDEGKEVDASELHSIQNATDIFNEVIAVRVVRGPYPARLLDLWELYDECRGSDNDNPALLPPEQHFAVLELANAGLDLESFTFAGAEQAHALLLQVALALAVGEEALQFEHRDLHWGNVLVAPSQRAWATCVVRGRVRRVPCKGVRATLIDYSLSRLALRGDALFCDLSKDESLFEAVGDRQFAVYRLMRERLDDDWSRFEPHTNVLWLHYLAGKMRTALRYEPTPKSAAKGHKQFLARLAALEARLLSYGSAAQFVLTDDEF